MMNLPPELIQIIFLKLCPTKTIFPLHKDPRLLVTHVCSQWRAIAVGMPNLWAHLRIPINLAPPYDHIRTWISRSVPSALSVWFYGLSDRNTISTEMFDLIVPAIQRCTSLKLSIDNSKLGRLLTSPPGSLRTLQSISIRPAGLVDNTPLYPIPCITAFQQCPWLRHMSFEVVCFGVFPMDPAVFDLPWHQLTHLNIHRELHEYKALHVLRQCTALQLCSISTSPAGVADIEQIAALARPVVLPCLHTLRLEPGDPWGHNAHFVHTLHLPRLCSLCLDSTSWCSCPLLPPFQPLLSETVRDLNLSRWTTMDLPDALALMPNLKTLTIDNSNAELLQALSGGVVVPRLVALTLDVVRLDDLFDMLEARAAAARDDSGVAVFNNVSALDRGNVDIDTTRLATLRASGMRLVFRNRLL